MVGCQTLSVVVEWCNACIHPVSYAVDPTTGRSFMITNARAMGPLDFAALFFAACIAALSMAAELKDIALVDAV